MMDINGAVSIQHLHKITGISERNLQRRAAKERWEYVEAAGKARGGKIRLYKIDSLPEDIKIAIMKDDTLLYRGRSDLVAVGSPDLSEAQNKIALARADLVRMYLAEKKKAKGKKQSVTKTAESFIAGYNTGALLPNVFAVIGETSVKSVERWALAFRRSNCDYTVIATNYGNRKGCRKVTQDEMNAALSFCLHQNRLRVTQAVRYAKMTLDRRQIPSPSSEATIRRVVYDWRDTHYDRWVFFREGRNAWKDKVRLPILRDSELLEVGEVLVADGHKLNFEILHPFTGKPSRMTMVLWYDWASRYPAGWEIMPTENVQCIAAGLRRAILSLGKMPNIAYLDNGAAFKAELFTSTDIDFEDAGFYGMFARLGIDTVFAIPYNPESKPIERFFGTFNELELMMPTNTGASIQDKPAWRLRNEKLHKEIHKKKYGGWVPTIEEANRIITGWMAEYTRRPHRGLRGLCPIDLWEAGKGPGVDPEMLTHLMMSIENKPVNRKGVHLFGRDYYDEALYGRRERVLVRYDIEDVSHVHVYDKTGVQKICTAKPLQGVHPMARLLGTKEDVALLEHQIKFQRRLEKETTAGARVFMENLPDLVAIPERTESEAVKPTPKTLPRGEAERIEAAAAKMKVLELVPDAPDPIYMSEADRYEALLERECQGEELALDDMTFMRYFEKTDLYQDLKDRFDFLRELFIAGPEDVEVGN